MGAFIFWLIGVTCAKGGDEDILLMEVAIDGPDFSERFTDPVSIAGSEELVVRIGLSLLADTSVSRFLAGPFAGVSVLALERFPRANKRLCERCFLSTEFGKGKLRAGPEGVVETSAGDCAVGFAAEELAELIVLDVDNDCFFRLCLRRSEIGTVGVTFVFAIGTCRSEAVGWVAACGACILLVWRAIVKKYIEELVNIRSPSVLGTSRNDWNIYPRSPALPLCLCASRAYRAIYQLYRGVLAGASYQIACASPKFVRP